MSNKLPAQRPVPVNRTAHLYSLNGQRVRVDLSDINTNRIGILHNSPIELGAAFKVRFSLHLGSNIKEVDALTKVTHNHIRNNKHFVVMRFIKIDQEHLDVVTQYTTTSARR